MKDLTKQRFGRLIALKPTKKRTNKRHVIWVCRCDCGKLTEVRGDSLMSGHTWSCGCLQREKASENGRISGLNSATHGDKCNGQTAELYRTWQSMKTRCGNPKNKRYHRYGGRGISICPEWRDSYPTFKAWALTHGYNDGLTIDRINNDGNYKPDNCQFLTKSENSKKRGK